MPLSAGDKLGPYEILAPIGAGGMGEVWKARDTRLDRIVALKTSSQKFSERFDREARAIAALNHPNICQIYDVGPDYIVMEYVEGARIKGPMPLDLALRAAIQLAAALDAAHRKAITHRDLKPDNILTTKSGVKVLDFGLAKFEPLKHPRGDETETRAITQEGSIVGTLEYMAPEQLQGKPADPRSDIFSFGCVFYEILTGKRAFRGDNQATLIAAILDRDPEPIALHQPSISPGLERVVKTCLAKDPDDRWQHSSDLKKELEWVLESSSSTIGAAAPAHSRRNIFAGGLLIGVLAAMLAAFALFYSRTVKAPTPAVRFEVPLPEGTYWGPNDFPAISPDGSLIMFAATRRDGSRSLWLRPMSSLSAQPIPGTQTTAISTGLVGAWSPDGRAIAHVHDFKLLKIDISGGAAQALGAVPVRGVPTWSSSGTILFTSNDAPFRLYQAPAAGGDAKLVMAPGLSQNCPSFLPDGRHFLYLVYSGESGLYIGSLDSKEGKRLTGGSSGVFAAPGWLLNVRGSTLVAQSFDPDKQTLSGGPIPIAEQVAIVGPNGGGFSISRNGVLAYRTATPPVPADLVWYDRQGNRVASVGKPALYTNPALSADGKRLAVSRGLGPINREIWVENLAMGTSSRFTFSQADDINPIWSPDGSKIAFSSNRKGNYDIYWKAASGAGADQLLVESTERKAVEDWSPDGKLLLFNTGTREVDALPMTGERKPYPVLKATFRQYDARLSPDGHWIAYVSEESGRAEIFVQTFPPTGGKWQISASGGMEPTWRGDGKELYFLNETKFMAADVSVNGSSIEAGAPKPLFDAPIDRATNRRNHYVAAADGQRFLFIATAKAIDTTPFVVVQNWQPALNR